MTAGAEIVCSEVACKVEIEEKCVFGLNTGGVKAVGAVATVDCNVGGNGNGNVGGTGKDGNGESTCVFVNGSIEVSAGDSGDTGGVNVEVDVDGFPPKSDLTDEVDQFTQEELGVENEGMPVDPLVSKTNGIVHEPTTVSVAEVKAVKDNVNVDNGSAVHPPVLLAINGIVQDVNGHLDKVSGEQQAEVKSTEGVDDTKEIQYVEAEMDNTGSGLTESILNTIEISQVTVSELESAIKPSAGTVTQSLSTTDVSNGTDESLSAPFTISNTSYEVMVNDGPESIINLIHKADCQVTADGSGKTSEDLKFKVTADGSESSGSSIEEGGHQGTVDGFGKPSDVLGSRVTADEPDSCGSPIKEVQCKGSVAGLDSIGSSVENQECPVIVDGPEPSGNHTEKVESNTIGMELDGKSEEHQELFVITSEVNVEVEPCHICSVIIAENKKAEGTGIGSGIESEENPVSGLVLSEEVNVLANGQVEKFDRFLEMGDTQISGTETDGSSEKLLEVTESVEMEVNTEEMKEQIKVEDEIQESQRVVIDVVQDELNTEDSTAESANEAEVSLEAETNIETVIPENTYSQYGFSNCIDKPQEGLEPEASSENVETANTIESECKSCDLLVEKDNGSLSNPDDLTVVEQKVEIESHLGTENRYAEGMDCGTGVENVDVFDDDEKEIEEKDADDLTVVEQKVEIDSHLGTENISAEGMDCGTGIENVDMSGDDEKQTKVKDAEDLPPEDMGCGTRVKNVVFGDEEKETEGKDAHVDVVHHIVLENGSSEDISCETGIKNVDFSDAPVGDRSTISFSDMIVNHGAVIEFGSIGRHVTSQTTPGIQNEEVEDMNGIQSDEIPNSSVEGEVNDGIDVQNEEVEVLEYNFLVKIPRFEDENFRDQIRRAQELVEEKTRIRDSIRAEVLEKRDLLSVYNKEYDAVKQEEIAARRVVKAKRGEIEAVQAVISRWKNAMSVEDIDARIFGVEYMIQHETIHLRDEKEFIREIKQLKSLRDQLASNMGTPEEIRHAIDMKDHNEARLKTLRKELGTLKAEVSKVLPVLEKIVVKYEEISNEERELQRQFRAADVVRQKAYAHLNSLKKLSYDKNQNYRQFKGDLSTAKTFLSQGDKDALHRLCANQVETFMEQWNNNDEFRQEYVSRCNAIRKQKALDGPPLVPDDVASVLPGNMNEKVDGSPVSIPGEVKHVPVVLPVEQVKDVLSTETMKAGKYIENVSGQKNQDLKNKGVAKPMNVGSVDMAKEEAEVAVVTELAENIPTKEENELARKAEELMKEEIAAKLKEQRRLEEKAKAIEALERKKRNAEKSQLRAELRARKEAEQKEKEREKRLRKKEKKTVGGDGIINGEEAAGSDGSNEAITKDIETTANKKKTPKPPAHFFSKQLKPKPVPPPVLNKNKKRWQQYGQPALAAIALLAVFLLANFGLFVDFKSSKFTMPV